MSITISTIEDDVKNWVRNQNLTDTRFLSAFNQAADIVFTQLGLPTQEKQYLYDFDETQPYYACPTDFLEPLGMRYYDDSSNSLNRNSPFQFTRPVYIYPRIQEVTSDTRLWSVDYETGSPRMIVLAHNTVAALQLDNFDDSASFWTNNEVAPAITTPSDAQNIANDDVTYIEGGGSMKFDIIVGSGSLAGYASLSRYVSTQDWWTYVDRGHFKLDYQFSNITNMYVIVFKWGTDANNYYYRYVTTQEDGTPFIVGWNYLDFPWSGCIEVGNPDPHSINFFEIDTSFNPATYTGGTNYRLDDLRLTVPDPMIMTYYTQNKGTNSTGTALTLFTATTDKLLVDAVDIGLRNLFTIYTAAIINPQILVEDTQAKEQFSYWTKYYQMRFPKRRLNQLLVNPTVSRTD